MPLLSPLFSDPLSLSTMLHGMRYLLSSCPGSFPSSLLHTPRLLAFGVMGILGRLCWCCVLKTVGVTNAIPGTNTKHSTYERYYGKSNLLPSQTLCYFHHYYSFSKTFFHWNLRKTWLQCSYQFPFHIVN